MKKQIIILTMMAVCAMSPVSAQSFFTNTGFEQWDTFSMYHQPRGWFTLNVLSQVGFEPGTRISTDANTGNYAVELVSVEGNFNNAAGILASGPLLDDQFMPDFNRLKKPFTQRPHGLQFYYKSYPAPSDTCALVMLLTRWNEATQSADTVGIASFGTGDTVNTYTRAEITFEYYTNQAPDSAYFIATSSLDGFNPQPGSTFLLDDMELKFTSVSLNQQTEKANLNLYPNPAYEYLHINVDALEEETDIVITDISGREIYRTKQVPSDIRVPLLGWEKGLYIVTINTNQFTLRKKFLHP